MCIRDRHSDAVESTARRRNGSQIARSYTPRARQKTGARMERASARFSNRCRDRRSSRPHC
eukprot:4610695-Lingulodinium_polyedra.AAC.1